MSRPITIDARTAARLNKLLQVSHEDLNAFFDGKVSDPDYVNRILNARLLLGFETHRCCAPECAHEKSEPVRPGVIETSPGVNLVLKQIP